MKTKIRVISIILILAFSAAVSPCVWALPITEGGETWNVSYAEGGLNMPFHPKDKYVSEQNPPTFTWPKETNAVSYDLIVCADEQLSDVKYSKSGVTKNYYNFDCTFETGIDYYWAVRWHKTENKKDVTGKYSAPRRFRIALDAYEFVLEDIDTVLSRVPQSHPRIWTTRGELTQFRALKDSNEDAARVYSYYVTEAETAAAKGQIPSVPTTVSEARKIKTEMKTCAFAYLLTGNTTFGNHAKKLLLAMSEWDISGVTSYENDDQVFREIAYESAMAYDWIYDLFSAAERQKVLAMIQSRGEQLYYLIDRLLRSPYESHGWTALGYLGIVCVATYGEISQAADWLKEIIPEYTAVLPPWSQQDGGWSQGTAYWQYSSNSNHEFMDVLRLAGILDLYQAAWPQNEYLWSLYAYPAGSYGSFGDQSNRTKAEESSTNTTSRTLGEQTVYTKNPVAKWLYNQLNQKLAETNPDSYFISKANEVLSQAPTDYPLAHSFEDIGWAVMTNNLMSKDRIQMTFKSSPYGSYNHSQADQNSFIIQAFGENLAVQSGWYDYYHSDHHSNFTRKTFAHNTITMNGGKVLQLDQDTGGFLAQGSLEYFVNGLKFDSVTGDATQAYITPKYPNAPTSSSDPNYDYYKLFEFESTIDKYERNMIYVRPDIFIVIDDLDAKDDTSVAFDWWLNAENRIEYTDSTALIKQGAARLNAQVQYPRDTTAVYYDTFYNPQDEKTYPASGSFASQNVQKRLAFSTQPCKNTKFVVTMDVYKEGQTAKEINTTYENNYMKMEFPDGTTVLVNLGDSEQSVQAGNITFRGAAVTYNDEAVLLTNGSYLKIGGEELVSASRNVTVSLGYEQFGLSANDDTVLRLSGSTKYLSAGDIRGLKDDKGRAATSAIGLTISEQNGSFNITAQKGNYALRSGGPISIEQLAPTGVQISADLHTGTANVKWNKKEGCTYDLKINGEIISNCEMPYSFPIAQEEVYKISVRTNYKGVSGDWSNEVSYSLSQNSFASYVQYSGSLAAGVGARAYVSNSNGGNVMLKMVAYDSDERVIDTKTAYGNDTMVENFFGNIPAGTAMLKTFIWAENSLEPLVPSAVYASNNTALQGIYLDGELIPNFDKTAETYTVDLSAANLTSLPVVTAAAEDNSTEVRVRNYLEEQKTVVEAIAQNGTRRSVTVQFGGNDSAKRNVENVKLITPTPPNGWNKIYTKTEITGNSGKNTNFATNQYFSPKLYDDFTEGAKAYVDRAETAFSIKNVNKILDIEGSTYIAPLLNLINGGWNCSWYMPYYFGLSYFAGDEGTTATYKFWSDCLDKTPQDWCSFELNRSAKISVATAGGKPNFIDDTWKELPVQNVFDIYNASGLWISYDKIYEKYIYVTPGETKTVKIQTPGTGTRNAQNLNFIFIKPVE